MQLRMKLHGNSIMVIIRPGYHTKLMTRTGLYPEISFVNLPHLKLSVPLASQKDFFFVFFLNRGLDGIRANG